MVNVVGGEADAPLAWKIRPHRRRGESTTTHSQRDRWLRRYLEPPESRVYELPSIEPGGIMATSRLHGLTCPRLGGLRGHARRIRTLDLTHDSLQECRWVPDTLSLETAASLSRRKHVGDRPPYFFRLSRECVRSTAELPR